MRFRLPAAWLVVVALAGACTKAPTLLSPVDWAATPRLPSPSAGTYAMVDMTPPDPGVRQVMGGRDWDASLGGAAAGIALDLVHRRGELTPPEIREAAWRAGWPYPVRSVHTTGTTIGDAAPAKVKQQLAAVPSEAHVGLVRARGSEQDLWVMLTSVPRVDVGVYPRQIARGSRITLPQLEGTRFAVADPQGQLYKGHLDVGWSTEALAEGEWLIELYDREGVIARFPMYVGMVPPQTSLLSAGSVPETEQDARAKVVTVLADVRDAYGLREPQLDTLLQNAVTWAQLNPRVPVSDVAARVGVDPTDLWRFDCTQATVEDCLDPLVWDPRARPQLLASSLLLGVAADFAPNGVHVTVLLARET